MPSVKQTKPAAKKPAGKPSAAKKSATKPAAAKPAKVTPSAKKASAALPKAAAKSSAKPKASKASASQGVLDVGSHAPAFKLKDQSGKEVSSASLAGSPYVLYFYPKDDTTGCTKEACGFRDSHRAFGRVARVLGVSPDSEASHARFAAKYGLPFTLLADPDKTLAGAYGVWVKKQNYGREYMGIARSTFLVDEKGVIQKAWRSVRVDGHVDAVLDAAKAL
jgi:thioredoxin-dependent peroxiredoxin